MHITHQTFSDQHSIPCHIIKKVCKDEQPQKSLISICWWVTWQCCSSLTTFLCFFWCIRCHPHCGPWLFLGIFHSTSVRAPCQRQQQLCSGGTKGKKIFFSRKLWFCFIILLIRSLLTWRDMHVTACQYQQHLLSHYKQSHVVLAKHRRSREWFSPSMWLAAKSLEKFFVQLPWKVNAR